MARMNVDYGVAERIARLRKLAGWNQHQLASRVFVSTSLVKKVEQRRTAPTPAFVAACARALGVDPSTLYGLDTDDVQAIQRLELSRISDLRDALQARDDPELTAREWSFEKLRRELEDAENLRRSFRYEQLCHRMPQLLHQLFAHCDTTAPDTATGENARAMLHDAYRLVATLGGRFRQPDVAAVASERHVALAPHTGDPLRVAISVYHQTTYLLQHGHFARGLKTLARGYSAVQESSHNARHAVSVQLHLRAAVLASRSGDQDTADQHVSEARLIVDQHAPPATPYYNIDASRLNIDIHWCAVPVENYDGTGSVTRAAQVTIADASRPERVGHHHIDMARAWLLHGNRENVLAELNAARRVSPHHTRRHPAVHETVRALAEGDRRATDSLAGFARWAGIHI